MCSVRVQIPESQTPVDSTTFLPFKPVYLSVHFSYSDFYFVRWFLSSLDICLSAFDVTCFLLLLSSLLLHSPLDNLALLFAGVKTF